MRRHRFTVKRQPGPPPKNSWARRTKPGFTFSNLVFPESALQQITRINQNITNINNEITRIEERVTYLGEFAGDPPFTEAGQWGFDTIAGTFKFWNGSTIGILGGTYLKLRSIPAEALGRPNVNPPTVVDQDNMTLYSFTLNTDRITWKFPYPSDCATGGLQFSPVWTNDNGVDDIGTNVRWELRYQVGSEGSVISGSHANSPKRVTDTYASASGTVEHHTPWMTIAESDSGGTWTSY